MERTRYLSKVQELMSQFPVVALIGPRQSGKTTLSRRIADLYTEGKVTFFDLEDPTHLSRLENPKLALEGLTGLVVIDEVQLRPDLFPVLRVLVDQPQVKRKFVILGSASRDLIAQSSETLAGRIAYLELMPFQSFEVSPNDYQRLWVRGGFPPSYLAKDDRLSHTWRESYIRTYLERDLPQLGIGIPANQMRRFWMMLTHYHGQVFNSSELARSLQLDDKTVRRYVDILAGTFMLRVLQPWHENMSKRQVKSFKVYLRDSGILHSLLGVQSFDQLFMHPKLGASWEGFALEQLVSRLGALPDEVFFWAVHGQAELDLFFVRDGRRIGVEIKYSDQPKVTGSMRSAIQLLRLDELIIIYPGAESFPLSEQVRVSSLNDFDI